MSPTAYMYRKPPTPPHTPVRSMSGLPSIGDILMLSQATWRTGRAFSSGRRCADMIVPEEFIQIESELNRLSKALKHLAELLVSEQIESFIGSADRVAQDGIGTIFISCRRTIEDLESVVSMYQSNRKSNTSGGFTIERLWNLSLLQNYNTFVWTADGGTIHELYELLRMHTVTISMLSSICESLSVLGLENSISSVAEKVQEIYQTHPTDLSAHLAEIRGLANAIGYDLPSPTGTMPPTPNFALTPNRLSSSTLNNLRNPSFRSSNTGNEPSPRSSPLPSANAIAALLNRKLPSRPQSISMPEFDMKTASSGAEKPFPESLPVSPKTEDPPISPLVVPGPVISQEPTNIKGAMMELTPTVSTSSIKHEGQKDNRMTAANDSITLQPSPLTDSKEKLQREVSKASSLSLFPQTVSKEEEAVLNKAEITMSQLQEFERTQFRNAVILCDLPGDQVEYTVPSKGLESLAGATELEQAMKSCRICLVREKKMYQGGKVVFTLAIWTFSDDMTTRMEQRLDERAEIIPFTSYFKATKVSITVPTELVYHSIQPGLPPIRKVQTAWVNYYFTTDDGSRDFQNQIFGRTLIASFKTERTLRIHEGLVGRMAHNEQMCAMENLRIWYEEETGGHLVLIHFSAMFRQGYMKFYLNNVNLPITFKDEGHKTLRLKGFRIPMVPGPREREKTGAPKKNITAAKIEFTSETDKVAFIDLIHKAQREMMDLE